MHEIERTRVYLLNQARLMHERAFAIEGACDAIRVLSGRERFGSSAIAEGKAKLRRWLDEYPTDGHLGEIDAGDK